MGIFSRKKKVNYINGLISIIVPVYNASTTLKRCLRSLVSQTYQNIEIICVDDGSTDTSLLLLETFADLDKRVKIIKNIENKGIAYSRNVGLENASGEYIMWCDSDDWYEKDMCKKMYKAITDNNCDLAVCSQNLIKNKNLKYRLLLEDLKCAFKLSFEGKYSNLEKIIRSNTLNVVLWNKIFKRSLIDKYDLKFPDLHFAEDTYFFLRYFSVSKTCFYLNEKLYNYVISENSTYGRFIKNKGYDALIVYEMFMKFLRKYKLKKFYDVVGEMYDDECNYRVSNTLKMSILDSLYLDNLVQKIPVFDMNLCFDVTNKSFEAFIVCITSIVESSKENEKFNCYVINNNLSDDNLNYLKKLNKKNKLSIEIVNIDKKYKNCPGVMLTPKLLPVDRCLYLDCDVIVMDSLKELYSLNFDDKYAIVVEYHLLDNKYNRCFLFQLDRYFNAGVMLMNLKKMKDDDMSNFLVNTNKNFDGILNRHDIFNLCFNSDVRFIHSKYNCQTFKLGKDQMLFEDGERPVIVHFNSRLKPWKKDCEHPYKYKYFEYLKISPLKENFKKYKELFFSTENTENKFTK